MRYDNSLKWQGKFGAWSAGAMYGLGNEAGGQSMRSFALAYQQDGVWAGERLLPEGWMKASTTVTEVRQSEEQGYAAGWWANKKADGSLVDPQLPEDTYWASGHDGQRVYVVPSAELVVVRLGFTPELEADQLRTDELVAELVAIKPAEG